MNMTPSQAHPPIPAATRVALVMLACVETLAGLLSLLGAALLYLQAAPGTGILIFGVLAPLTLLVPGGVGIFVRQKWSYLLHCLVLPVALVGAALFLATVTGASRGLPVILMTVLASTLMELFFLSRDVRRWFGLFPGQ